MSLLDVFSGLLTPVIAVTAAYIAYQQYRLNRQRFKFETYERRLMVYKTVQTFLSEIVRDGGTTYSRCSEFYSKASEATFLFDPAVQNYIDQIYSRAGDLVALHEEMYPPNGSPGLPIGDERSRVAREEAELQKWFGKQIAESRKLFKKEMALN